MLVKIVYLLGISTVISISYKICNAISIPLSSAIYIIKIVDMPIYSIRLVYIFLAWILNTIIATLIRLLIPLPLV